VRRRYYRKYQHNKQNYDWWGEKVRFERRWNRIFYPIFIGMVFVFLYHGGKFLYNQMGVFGFLLLGILASLFYIIPKVAMPKDTQPKVLKRKKRRRRK
jgi:hypothetical protein|tara:strand:+ start:220 stop:513 length:294 start_codon:yes stop_codon:yes gene_type:complete